MVAAPVPVKDPGPGRPALPPKKRSLARRLLRAALIAIGLPLIVALAIVFWLHTSSGQRFVRTKVQARLAQRVNGTVELGQLDFTLFGAISIGGLRIRDETGADAIALESLRVVPNWRSLTSGSPIIESVTLRGLSVHVRQDADGGSNLKRLFKPTPPSPPTPPKPPSRARFQVRQIAISDVALSLEKPDGTRIGVSSFAMDASVDAVPGMKTVRLTVPRIAADLSLDKPEGALSLAVSRLETGITVALENGAGKVSLARTKAHARMLQKGAEPRETDLDLGGVDLDVAEGQIEATLTQLLVGALVLQSLEVKGKTADGALSGDQKVSVIGLHVDAARLNTLLQKQLVASDIDIDTRFSGPPERVVVTTTIRTQGGSLGLDGSVDVSNLARPGYDLTLTGSDIRTEGLLLPGASTAPKVESKSIRLGVKGRGATKEHAEANIVLALGPTTVGRLVIDEATLEARYEKGELEVKKLVVKTLGQRLELEGRFHVVKRHVKGQLRLAGDIGVALSRARAAGIPVKASVAPGTAVVSPGDLTVDVEGDLDGVIAVDVAAKRLALAGGSISATAHADLEKKEVPDGSGAKRFQPTTLSADVAIHDLDLGALAALRGKQLPGVAGTVSGKVHVGGSPADPAVDYAVRVNARADLPLTGFFKTSSLVVDLHGKATKTKLDAELTAQRDDGMKLIGATVEAPLLIEGSRRGLAPGRPLHVKLDLPRRAFADYLALVPKPILIALGKNVPKGELEAHVDLSGTAEHPEGTFDIDVGAGILQERKQRVHIAGKLVPKDRATRISSSTSVWLDADKPAAAVAEIGAEVSRSPLLPGPKEVEWSAAVKVPRISLADLPIPPEKLGGTTGTVAATIDLHGTATDALGKADVDLGDVRLRNSTGPLTAHASLELQPASTVVDVGVAVDGKPALRTSGTIGLAGKGLIPAARAKAIGDPALQLDLDIPRRRLADFGVIRPPLLAVPGEISGHGIIRGTVKVPTADAGIAYDGFTTIAGGPGRAGIDLHADAAAVRAEVGIGAPEGKVTPVRIGAELPRAALAEYRAGEGKLPITLSARADAVDLRTLVPAFTTEGKGIGVAGRLDWKMDGKLALEKTDTGAKVAEGALDGRFEITRGKISLPHAKRTYEDVELRLASDASALRIESLSLRESDLDKPHRTLAAKGKLAWTNLHPERLALDLQAKDWLLFGSEKIGPADAPRGALTADIGIAADIRGPIKKVTASVWSLELLFPERFARAHQPEVTSLGDVVYLDQTSAPAGKLARAEPAGIATEKEQEQFKGAPPAPAEPPPEAESPTGVDVIVHIPRPIHVNQAPLDVHAQGDIHAFLGGGKKKVEGKLEIVRGNLMLGGKRHDLDKGVITFDEQNPGGWMDLHFSRKLPPSTTRDISTASAGGDAVRIDMVGPVGKQKVIMRGAGNAYLYDVLAVNNVGRVRVYAQPDMPASSAVQIPQPDTLLGLTYMAINLPHNLYFEHFGAWADPYDDPKAYGRVQHLEAEHDSASGGSRVRVVSRPHAAGQNSSELQLDWLFANSSRALFGVGVRGGERAGGGPGIFFEWSSED